MKTIIKHDILGNILSTHSSNITLHDYLTSEGLSDDATYIEIDGFQIINIFSSYIDISSTPYSLKEKEVLEINTSKVVITSDGVDTTTISNIPQNVFVTWPDGQRDEVTDGVVEFSTTQPDTYNLKFDGVKYLTEEVSIEAHV